ncbi:MAG: TetR/AcrR family transcriptional regulator [Burkholderiaceae bacterium]|nr:TetR/AcrR family transcriptional regulator [Microbacteriaceae bacterium]
MSSAVPPARPAPPAQPTLRSRAKADRRVATLAAAARLFALRGFNGVSIEDLGAAVGISGPAVYRHFPGKPAVLAAILTGVSADLLAGGQAVLAEHSDARAAIAALVHFHVAFALDNPEVIRVQDRDLDSLADDDRHRVRTLQRDYVSLWVDVLGSLHPSADVASRRIRALATFGLINSTPHSAVTGGRPVAPRATVRPLLEGMALAALLG